MWPFHNIRDSNQYHLDQLIPQQDMGGISRIHGLPSIRRNTPSRLSLTTVALRPRPHPSSHPFLNPLHSVLHVLSLLPPPIGSPHLFPLLVHTPRLLTSPCLTPILGHHQAHVLSIHQLILTKGHPRQSKEDIMTRCPHPGSVILVFRQTAMHLNIETSQCFV